MLAALLLWGLVDGGGDGFEGLGEVYVGSPSDGAPTWCGGGMRKAIPHGVVWYTTGVVVSAVYNRNCA